MHVRVYYVTFFLSYGIICRNSIQYFIAHKKVKHITIKVLENLNNSCRKWIEYKYVFENKGDESLKLQRNLKVGIFVNSWMKSDLMGCRISTSECSQTILTGYNADVVKSLQENLNISAEFICIENLNKLLTREVDFVTCQPHMEVLPSNVIELYPTMRNNLILVFRPEKLHFTKDIFILTFAGSLWLVFFAMMILLAVCLRMSTQRYARIKPKYEAWSWVEITLWAIAAACQQGLSHTPSGFTSCLIFFLGYLMAYLLYTGLAAAITSILVENIGTIADLKNIRTDKFHLICLENTRFHVKQLKSQFLVTDYVSNLNEFFKQLDNDDKIGVGPEIAIEQYMNNHFNYDQLPKYQTMKLTRIYSDGFLIMRHNPWRRIIHRHLAALDESGTLQNILKRNLRSATSFYANSGYSSAGQEHVGSATILYLGGVVASLLFFLTEFVYFLYKRRCIKINKK